MVLVGWLEEIVFRGFLFRAMEKDFHKSGSLWPCIVAHSLIDVLAVLGREVPDELFVIGSVFIIVVAGGYAWYLSRLPGRDSEGEA